MNFLNESIASFAKLQLRERLLAVLLGSIVLYFIVNLALLAPQEKKIKHLQQLDKAHKVELASINKTLDEMEKGLSKGLDPQAGDRATLDALKKQIADGDAFFGQTDATTSQVGTLVKDLLDTSPGLTLVSFRTLPAQELITPSKASQGDKAAKGSVEIQKIIYKHGVEISVKGNYMMLLSYMENLQKYPKRLFWSQARLDVPAYPEKEAVLKLLIYSLSDQPVSPLR